MQYHTPPDISEDGYEEYLNEFAAEMLGHEVRSFDPGWAESYGTYLREHSPTTFRCGYNDWIDYMEQNGDITYECENCLTIGSGHAEDLPDDWHFEYEVTEDWEYYPDHPILCQDCWEERLDEILEPLVNAEFTADELEDYLSEHDMDDAMYERIIAALETLGKI